MNVPIEYSIDQFDNKISKFSLLSELQPSVHGPYIPHRYYGPKDVPLGEVKLGELPGWISRRDKSPRAFFHAISRMRHLWFYKWSQPKNATGAVMAQFCVITSLMFYCASYSYQSKFADIEAFPIGSNRYFDPN